uniref:Coiled-coil domain containing 66 n=1 Tax=Poecilia formosa TaxID=48698 RepID=A0A096MB05_POEFO
MKQEGDDEYGRLHRSSFSWFKERRPDSRAAIDAKKAQWKRELDEQVALKQQLQLSALSRLQVFHLHLNLYSTVYSPGLIPSSCHVSNCSSRTMQIWVIQHDADGELCNQTPLLQEVTPMEEMLSVERKEEQRRVWLEELDRQREETAERRKQEKLQRRQTEDHEHWAAHFDSLQRRAPAQPAAPGRLSGSERDDWNPSSSLSLVWEGTSSCGADSVMAASVDSTRGFPSRSSYLRTMTSLLDPAQIEERERRRLKQLEQQRFILAQRAIEAQKLQKQYELEILKKKEKVRGQKMSHLHHWQKINSFRFHQKRKKKSETIRFLLFSFWSSFRTIRSLRRSSQRSTAGRRRRPDPEKCKVTNVAVLVPSLTESIGLSDVKTVLNLCGFSLVESKPCWACMCFNNKLLENFPVGFVCACSAVTRETESVENGDSGSSFKDSSVQTAAEPNSRSRAPRAGKENICLPAGEDPYAPFARTERSRRSKTRPEWGTQRPSRRFVPASERYPVALQRDRQESRLRRQAELLALQKTRPSRTELPAPQQEARLCPNGQQSRTSPTKKVENQKITSRTVSDRSVSLIKQTRAQSQQAPSSPPPALEFIPYLRTAEVFSLDPLEPANTPPPRTHPGIRTHNTGTVRWTLHKGNERDPLLHPEMLPGSQRQQEILRGLAQLRQGLLQKQKELETDLKPVRNRRDNEQRALSAAHRT